MSTIHINILRTFNIIITKLDHDDRQIVQLIKKLQSYNANVTDQQTFQAVKQT